YMMWSGSSRIEQAEALSTVLKSSTRTELSAIPLGAAKTSAPWLTAPKKALVGIRKVIARSDYRAYAGCCTWMNGVYWVRILKNLFRNELQIENLFDVGKIKLPEVTVAIEKDLVYPLLRGRDVKRWTAKPSSHIILAQDPESRKGIPESLMKKH